MLNFETMDSFDLKLINKISKDYNPLDYPGRLLHHLKCIFPSLTFANYSKFDLHKLLNQVILENYGGEQIFKYKLFEQFLNQKNLVGAFEIKVNNSRADFLAINGHTRCFEIKTALDNFSKFNKQSADYMLAFEYNYLLVDECHLEKAKRIIPDSFGLWINKNGKARQIKKASLNKSLNPEIQLSLLTKREVTESFPLSGGLINTILNENSDYAINKAFKRALKERYLSRWKFIVVNQKNILPMDLQFFFNNNISPKHIYYH